MIIFIILFLFILLLIIYFNTNNNKYLTKNELIDLLISDSDNYYNTFNKKDYITRNINTISDYHQIIINSSTEINNIQIKKINILINKINNKLINFKISGFNGKRASEIPWILGFIKGTEYESGFPHTRSNIIIIPINLLNSEKILENILIHEKIHIYQKIYPNDVQIYLTEYKFNKYIKRPIDKNEPSIFDDIRANPDINNWIYTDKNNNIVRSKFLDNPKSINDVIFLPENILQYEHPYEFMAYDLQNRIYNQTNHI